MTDIDMKTLREEAERDYKKLYFAIKSSPQNKGNKQTERGLSGSTLKPKKSDKKQYRTGSQIITSKQNPPQGIITRREGCQE